MRYNFRYWPRRRAAVRAKAVIPVITLAVVALASGCGTASPSHVAVVPIPLPAPPSLPPVQPRGVSASQMALLPMATTFGTTPAAPQDPAPFEPETGIVLHPLATRVVYARPGGPPAAALPVTELGSPTWVPVVQSQPGWDLVLLPTRPNRSTGWIYLGGGGLQAAYSAYRVEINLATYRQNGTLALNPGQAVADADAYLAKIGATGTATATANLVTVTVTIVQPMQILSAAGLHAVTVRATATAVPVRGINGEIGGFANTEGLSGLNPRVVTSDGRG